MKIIVLLILVGLCFMSPIFIFVLLVFCVFVFFKIISAYKRGLITQEIARLVVSGEQGFNTATIMENIPYSLGMQYLIDAGAVLNQPDRNHPDNRSISLKYRFDYKVYVTYMSETAAGLYLSVEPEEKINKVVNEYLGKILPKLE